MYNSFLATFVIDAESLTLPVPIPDEEKKLHFYFHTFYGALKDFVKALKVFHKIFWGTTKTCENKNLSWFLF